MCGVWVFNELGACVGLIFVENRCVDDTVHELWGISAKCLGWLTPLEI